jgi:hypothetical protein
MRNRNEKQIVNGTEKEELNSGEREQWNGGEPGERNGKGKRGRGKIEWTRVGQIEGEQRCNIEERRRK